MNILNIMRTKFPRNLSGCSKAGSLGGGPGGFFTSLIIMGEGIIMLELGETPLKCSRQAPMVTCLLNFIYILFCRAFDFCRILTFSKQSGAHFVCLFLFYFYFYRFLQKSEAILLASTWTAISPLFPTEYFLNDLVFWLVFFVGSIPLTGLPIFAEWLAIAYGNFPVS